MEKFALLDFLKAFESLTAKQTDAKESVRMEENGQNTQPAPRQQPVQPEIYETNVMANVIARHEEIANRIRNKRSV